MRTLVVYASLTGNTKKVAEAVAQVMPEGCVLAPVRDAPDPEAFDFIALGFWVTRGGPDPTMARYMERVKGKRIGIFATLAAWPDSPHADKVRARARTLLEGNEVLCEFLCQGRLDPKLRRGMEEETAPRAEHKKRHPMTPERKARLDEAEKHPDEQDLQNARDCFTAAVRDALR